jgi:cytochrome c peroxidase
MIWAHTLWFAGVLTGVIVAVGTPALHADSGRSAKFAAIQFTPVPGAIEQNRARLAELITEAAHRGARYVVLPELSVSGPLEQGENARDSAVLAESIPGATTEYFSAYTKQLGIWLVLSLLEQEAPDHRGYYITTVLLDETGKVLYKLRKVLPGSHAPDHLSRGNPWTILDSIDDRGRRIGILAGDDLQVGVPRLASRGADTILVAAQWTADDPMKWGDLCRKLSQQYQVHLVVANVLFRPGTAAGQALTLGGIYTHDGAVVASQDQHTVQQVLMASLARPPMRFQLPSALGLPAVPVPTYYPMTQELVGLGRTLFFDTTLSRDGLVSCGTCHLPKKAFANGTRTGIGVYERSTRRNTPSLLNVAFRAGLFWDGLAATLESQAKYPMSHATEMDQHYLDKVMARVQQQPAYLEKFRAVFGDKPLEFEDIAKALASYQRTLISGNSAFDRFYYGGQDDTLSPEAKRGLALFVGKANCVTCHTIGEKSALFMDQDFHNTGVGFNQQQETFTDLGLGGLSHKAKSGFFLTPSLRNVSETAPYMHDGSLATLPEVVEFYNKGGNANPYLDPNIRPLHLSPRDINDLVAFLNALTGNQRFSDSGEMLAPHTQADPKPRGQFVHAAALQFTPRVGQVEQNRIALEKLIVEAAHHGSHFVMLPEHALTGPLSDWALPSQQWRALAQDIMKNSLDFFARLTRKLGVWLVVPVPEYDNDHNALYLAYSMLNERGEVVAQYRKLSAHREWGDGEIVGGDEKLLHSIETPVGRLGILAGDDLQRGLPRLAALGAATILVSASWQPTDAIDWLELCVRLAKTYKVNLVISNTRDRHAGVDYGAVIASDGEVLVRRGPLQDNDILYAVLEHPVQPGHMSPPLGLPPPPQPTYNALTPVSVALGRKLFFDKNLSQDGMVSCATCHDPRKAFTNGAKVGKGVFGREGKANVPSVLNSAYRAFLFWDGRAGSLETQVQHATHGWAEMSTDVQSLITYLEQTPSYKALFQATTGRDVITFDDITRCLANYQRTLLSARSSFDRYFYAGKEQAMNMNAKRGLHIFMNKGGCVTCHSINKDYALFMDNKFHNTGIGYHKRFEYLGYLGDGLESNPSTKNTFRGEYVTPSLRNVALTAPYMHDGSLATLAEVVQFYNRGGNKNPFLSPAIKPLELTDIEQDDLVEFLQALTSEQQFDADDRIDTEFAKNSYGRLPQ